MHFNMTVNLTYSPPMTTDNGYYPTIFSDLFARAAMYRRKEASACPITLSIKPIAAGTILMLVVWRGRVSNP